MSRATAQWRPSPSRATSAARRAILCVSCLAFLPPLASVFFFFLPFFFSLLHVFWSFRCSGSLVHRKPLDPRPILRARRTSFASTPISFVGTGRLFRRPCAGTCLGICLLLAECALLVRSASGGVGHLASLAILTRNHLCSGLHRPYSPLIFLSFLGLRHGLSASCTCVLLPR
jgi:hypothetical protein